MYAYTYLLSVMSTNTSLASNQANQLTAIPSSKRERMRLIKKYPGTLAMVARQCRVRSSSVTLAFKGQSRSFRIEQALLAEFNRRIENEHKAAASKTNGQ